MTNEVLNQELYQKMKYDFEEFEDNLLQEDPREMLQSAYGYMIRQDILCVMEDLTLSEKECKVLLSQPHPLESIYEKWLDHECSYVDELRDSIRCTASQKLRDEFLAEKRNSR